MKKTICMLLAMLLLVGLVGCSRGTATGAGGHEGVINAVCKAVQTGDSETLISLLDVQSIEKGFEAIYSESSKKGVSSDIEENLEIYTKQEAFQRQYDDYEYEYGKNFVVEHGNLYEEEENSLGDLEKYQRLRKLENKNETLTVTESVNAFVDGLTDIKVVTTTMVIRDKEGEGKNRTDVTFYMYQSNGKWYLDQVTGFAGIATPGMLTYVFNVLQNRNTEAEDKETAGTSSFAEMAAKESGALWGKYALDHVKVNGEEMSLQTVRNYVDADVVRLYSSDKTYFQFSGDKMQLSMGGTFWGETVYKLNGKTILAESSALFSSDYSIQYDDITDSIILKVVKTGNVEMVFRKVKDAESSSAPAMSSEAPAESSAAPAESW